MIRPAIRIIFLVVYVSLTAFFGFAFYDRYYRHLDCFNDRGRCFDADDGIVYTDGGMVWGLFAAVFAALTVLSILRLVLAHLRHRKGPR